MAAFSGLINGIGNIKGPYNVGGTWVRNTDFDIVFYPDATFNDIEYWGIPKGYASISGGLGSVGINEILNATATIAGTWAPGWALSRALTATGSITAEFLYQASISNFVMWSKIGSAVFDMDLQNDAGNMPMPWAGTVLNILQFDKNAVVYGDKGIGLLVPVSSPAPVFGFKLLPSVGVVGTLSVTGDDKIHYYVNANRELCSLTTEGVTVLGYKQLLSNLASNMILTLDRFRDRLYIRDATQGFVYNQKALGGGPAGLSSIVNQGNTVEFYAPVAQDLQSDFSFTTGVLDFESRVKKTITGITVNTDNPGLLYVSVGTRVNASSDWLWSAPRRLNRENLAVVNVTGVDFKVKVYSDQATPVATKIDSLYIKYLSVDNRFRAGKKASSYQRQGAQA